MNPIRSGRFTSSSISALMKSDRSGKGFGAPALTYIEEKAFERRLGRSLHTETNARPTLWGKCLESMAFSRLPIEYELTSTTTITHPDYPFWAGSPDGVSFNAVFDIKCPYTLKSFCQLVNPKLSVKDKSEEYYWQLVSNAILTGKDEAELIVFCPFKKDLNEIRLMAMDNPSYRFIEYLEDHEMPYLIEGQYYTDLNILRFEVPQSDKEALTERVEMAEVYLQTLLNQ